MRGLCVLMLLAASPLLYATAAAHGLGFLMLQRAFQNGGALASLGAMTAAQLFDAAREAIDGLDASLTTGDYAPLREWLRTKIHREGYRLDAEDRVKAVTGRGLTDDSAAWESAVSALEPVSDRAAR